MDNFKANILIVDDEMGPRESLKMILKPYYNVWTAERGGQAIEIMQQVPIDLVTIDLKMPGLPGTKVLEKVKEHNPDVEAIIITGYGSMDTAIEGLRLGAFDYIAKPFDVNHILNLVRRALDRKSARIRLKQLKDEFLSNVSHEFRTPLSVVIGFVGLLLEQLVGPLTEQQRSVLERIYKNSEDLLELIENVLTLSALNAGEAPKVEESFDLGLMIAEQAQRYEKSLSEKGIEISVQLPTGGAWVVSDRDKLVRIFRNLLHNAIKFTSQGSIRIVVHRSTQRGVVDLEITDAGVGIPAEQIENMFQPFRQLDNTLRRDFSGLGVGLTVVRRLVDVLEGRIEIRSQPGHGTHVLVSLPQRAGAHKGGVANLRP
jgi:signal transduction histidine kinase